MASIRDSVIDQFGNAVPGALVILFSNDTGAQLAAVGTDGNGFFEFNNLPTGSYRLQISGANITTRIITPITLVEPYSLATQTTQGLMSPADKTKLDNVPSPLTLESLTDVTFSVAPTGGEIITYNSSGFWFAVKPTGSVFALKSDYTKIGGTDLYANKYPQLNGNGLLDYSFLDVSPIGGAGYAGQLPVLNLQGKLDPSLFDSSQVGGGPASFKLAQLGGGGLLDTGMINTAGVGGASSANKIPKLNASGRIDPSMLPTSSGTFRGSVDLTIAYVAPGWAEGDYGANSTAGTVEPSWLPHLNDPVPETVKVGDNVYYTAGKFSVVPSTVDLAAYLPRDGSQPMTGQLSLVDQSGANLPVGAQALSRAGADRLYQPAQAGTLPSVTQTTSKSTPVAINAITGKIVMHNGSLPIACLAGPRPAKFAMANNKIVAGSTVHVDYLAGGTTGGYRCWAGDVVAGSCNIYVENISGAALAQPITLQFNVTIGGV